MIVTVDCNAVINPERIVVESDPVSIAEFRKALAQKGMNVNDRIVVNFDDKPGKITAYSYPPAMWSPNMMTMSFKALTSEETIKAQQMAKFHRERGGIKVRWQDPDTGMIMTQDRKTGMIVPYESSK